MPLTPDEASAKDAHVTTDRTTLSNVAGDVVQEVQGAETAYAGASPAVQEIEKDLTPVLGGEPAVVIGVGAGVVIAILSLTHVLSVDTATGFVVSVGPAVAGFLTRFNVFPVAK